MQFSDPWQPIQVELSALLRNDEYIRYRSLKLLLESLQQAVDAQRSNPNVDFMKPEDATTFIEVVKYIQAQTHQGGNIHELVRQVASGSAFTQSQWRVQGNVNQAGRDLTIQIFNQSLPKIKDDEPDPRIEVSVVLLVMNAEEASELASEKCFQHYPTDMLVDFRQLQSLLEANNMANWVQRYGETARAWRPFRDSQETIEQVLEEAFSRIKDYQKRVVPYFLDLRTINTNRSELKKLRTEGCVVIMDVISMRHPNIQREFRHSLLDAFPNILVVKIDPIRKDMLEDLQQLVVTIERHIDSEFYKRFKEDYDELCEEVDSRIDFGRWLKNRVTRHISVKEKEKVGIQKQMF